jgi:hypothetical protein
VRNRKPCHLENVCLITKHDLFLLFICTRETVSFNAALIQGGFAVLVAQKYCIVDCASMTPIRELHVAVLSLASLKNRCNCTHWLPFEDLLSLKHVPFLDHIMRYCISVLLLCFLFHFDFKIAFWNWVYLQKCNTHFSFLCLFICPARYNLI